MEPEGLSCSQEATPTHAVLQIHFNIILIYA
jgi:hypothetical protein